MTKSTLQDRSPIFVSRRRIPSGIEENAHNIGMVLEHRTLECRQAAVGPGTHIDAGADEEAHDVRIVKPSAKQSRQTSGGSCIHIGARFEHDPKRFFLSVFRCIRDLANNIELSRRVFV